MCPPQTLGRSPLAMGVCGRIVFQPIYRLEDGGLAGVECLR